MKREVVKLRFDVKVTATVGQEGSAGEPTQILEVDLAKLPEADRQLLVRRMERAKDNVFDICRLQWDGTKEFRRPTLQEGLADFYAMPFPVRVQASAGAVESLLEAIREDYQRFKVR